MPEGYTHVRTARKAAEKAGYCPAVPEAFAAGANGPDILFAYEVWKSAAGRTVDLPGLGNRMHEEKTGAFLTELVRSALSANEKDYVLGFLNHYATDSTVHPYVEAVQQPGMPYCCKGGHGYFEIGLDSMLYKTDFGTGLVPADASLPVLKGAVRGDIAALMARALGKVYGVEVTPEKIGDAYDMLRFVRIACASRWGIRRRLFWLVEPAFGGRGYITGHCTPAALKGLGEEDGEKLPNPWQDPGTGERHSEDVTELLERAAEKGAVYMNVVLDYWNGRAEEEQVKTVLGSRSYSTGLEVE